jgi:hypothetical protein
MADSKKNRKAVIAAAREVAKRRRDWDDMGELVEALRVLDQSERVSEFQAKMRKRGVRLCDVGDCWLRADHVEGSHSFSDDPNRCTYVEDGMRCSGYGDERYHTDHILDDR